MMNVLKKAMIPAALLLICLVLIGTASADRGYTTTSQIPMAADFSVEVTFDGRGLPQVVTDYPFDKTGATEMNLVYNKGDFYEAATVSYNPRTDATVVNGYNSYIYPDGDITAICRDIRSGDLVMDDIVCVGTSNFGPETDWFLRYSLSRKEYVEYTEKTYAQAFNAMGPGGTASSVIYEGGMIKSSTIIKRLSNSDLYLDYSKSGSLIYASVSVWGDTFSNFDYDPATGLFSGRKLSELGYDEEDLLLPAPAALGDAAAEDAPAAAEETSAAAKHRFSPVVRVAGALVIGILGGVLLYYRGRRRKEDIPKEAAKETAEDNHKE